MYWFGKRQQHMHSYMTDLVKCRYYYSLRLYSTWDVQVLLIEHNLLRTVWVGCCACCLAGDWGCFL